jgi:hypothetical protein
MKVFRYGKFYTYNESFGDSSWNKEQLFSAASLYATCKHLGYNENLSYSLSYMFITSESVPGTVYEEKYVNLLQTIMGRVETA